MYMYNMRPMKVLNNENKSWLDSVKGDQLWAEQSGSDLVGGFAIEANAIPERGSNHESIRLVLPNRIWVMKLWRISWSNIKDMIYKGLNIRLYNGDHELSNDRLYILMKPVYDQRSVNYTTYNGKSPIDHIEFGQPFYVIDCGKVGNENKNYLVFLEHLGIIAVSTLEEIKEYNEDRVANSEVIPHKKLTTTDGLLVAYTPEDPKQNYNNDKGLIIGVNRQTVKPVSIAAFPDYFDKQPKDKVIERDYLAHYAPGHIIAPLAKNAEREWIL